MAKKMKILGLGLPTLAVAGAAIWYFFIRKKTPTSAPVRVPVKLPPQSKAKIISGLGQSEIEVF